MRKRWRQMGFVGDSASDSDDDVSDDDDKDVRLGNRYVDGALKTAMERGGDRLDRRIEWLSARRCEDGIVRLRFDAVRRGDNDEPLMNVYAAIRSPDFGFNKTGQTLWPSGFFAVEFLIHRGFECDSALELGAGVGFTACALCLAGVVKGRMIASDLFDQASDLAEETVRLNELSNRVDVVRNLSWKDSQSFRRIAESCDLLVACDLLYDPSDVPDLIDRVFEFVAMPGTPKVALLVSTERNEETHRLAVDLLAARSSSATLVERCSASEFPALFRSASSTVLADLSSSRSTSHVALVTSRPAPHSMQ